MTRNERGMSKIRQRPAKEQRAVFWSTREKLKGWKIIGVGASVRCRPHMQAVSDDGRRSSRMQQGAGGSSRDVFGAIRLSGE